MLGATPQIKLPTSKMKMTDKSEDPVSPPFGVEREDVALTDPFSGNDGQELSEYEDEAGLG
jgi:hypothetical protein